MDENKDFNLSDNEEMPAGADNDEYIDINTRVQKILDEDMEEYKSNKSEFSVYSDFISDLGNNGSEKTESGEEPLNMERQDKEPKNKNGIKIAAVIAGVIVLVAGLVFSVQALFFDNAIWKGITGNGTDSSQSENEKGEFVFAKDVTVSGVSLGGKTIAEAEKLIEKAKENALPTIDITVNVADKEESVTADDLNFTFNEEEVLKEAEAYSKGEIKDEGENSSSSSGNFELKATLDNASVSTLAKKIADKYYEKPKNAKVSKFDTQASGKDMFTCVDGTSGQEIDEKSLGEKLSEALMNLDYFAIIDADVTKTEPSMNAKTLKKKIVLLSSFTTISTNNANGNSNMATALNACDGSIIDPGDVWSFNGCTGNSNLKSNGYKDAGVIINGSASVATGGGVCQASTTIYNAAIRADMDIVARQPHHWASTYVYAGFDATIDYGNIDLKLSNPSEFQRFFKCWMSGTVLHCEIYGVKSGSYASIGTYSKNYDITSSTYKTEAYRIYYNSKGDEIKREKLPNSTYHVGSGHSVRTADGGGNETTVSKVTSSKSKASSSISKPKSTSSVKSSSVKSQNQSKKTSSKSSSSHKPSSQKPTSSTSSHSSSVKPTTPTTTEPTTQEETIE